MEILILLKWAEYCLLKRYPLYLWNSNQVGVSSTVCAIVIYNLEIVLLIGINDIYL